MKNEKRIIDLLASASLTESNINFLMKQIETEISDDEKTTIEAIIYKLSKCNKNSVKLRGKPLSSLERKEIIVNLLKAFGYVDQRVESGFTYQQEVPIRADLIRLYIQIVQGKFPKMLSEEEGSKIAEIMGLSAEEKRLAKDDITSLALRYFGDPNPPPLRFIDDSKNKSKTDGGGNER